MKKNLLIAGLFFVLIGLLAGGIFAVYHFARKSIKKAPVANNEVMNRLQTQAKQYPPIPGTEVMIDAAAKISPSVVNIDVASRRGAQVDIFGNVFPSRVVVGRGSGVIISPDGYVVTNNHVVEGAEQIRVKLSNGTSKTGTIIGADRDTDLAVIKIDGKDLPAAELGDSDKLRVAETVIAVGNPLGFENTVTVGVVSALHRNLDVDDQTRFADAIQTDAAINHGNSGGALANLHGQLIGINAVIAGSGDESGNIGIGFAIPVNTLKRVVGDLIKQGKVTRAWLGVETRVPTIEDENIAIGNNKPEGEVSGMYIVRVVPQSPAEQAGLKSGDIIVAIGGKPVRDGIDLRNHLDQNAVGSDIMVSIWRAQRKIEVKVRLAERPNNL